MSSDIDGLLAKSNRFVAFLDVLGYKSVLSEPIQEDRRFRLLYSLCENLGVAVETALSDSIHAGAVDAVSFSDSYYFSGKDLSRLLHFLEHVFQNAYAFQSSTYDREPDSWIPFIRAGVVEGWAVSFRDATLTKLPRREVFRNPVGPAVAAAYQLTEKRGKLPGMRCFLESTLLDRCSPTKVAEPPHYRVTADGWEMRLLDVPVSDLHKPDLRLVELAWPCRVIAADNCGFLDPIIKSREQFSFGEEPDQQRRDEHYNATIDLFRRSVDVCDDSHVRLMWNRLSGDLKRR